MTHRRASVSLSRECYPECHTSLSEARSARVVWRRAAASGICPDENLHSAQEIWKNPVVGCLVKKLLASDDFILRLEAQHQRMSEISESGRLSIRRRG
jgi:hypothetical protein